jgi:hypothetical protein
MLQTIKATSGATRDEPYDIPIYQTLFLDRFQIACPNPSSSCHMSFLTASYNKYQGIKI